MGKWKVVRNLERKHVCRTTIWMHKHCTKNEVFLKDFFSNANLVTFTEEILRWKLHLQQKKHHQQNIYRTFANLIKNVKIEKFCTKSTVRQGTWWCITSRSMHYNILQRKHPEGSPKNANVLLEGPFQKASPEIHDKITPTLKTKGATGPSCFDGDDWRQIIGINT